MKVLKKEIYENIKKTKSLKYLNHDKRSACPDNCQAQFQLASPVPVELSLGLNYQPHPHPPSRESRDAA